MSHSNTLRAFLLVFALGSLSACGEPAPFSCPDGMQDEDGDRICAPSCESDTCGDHGTCSISMGTAVCACTAGYAGADCRACATGYQDGDADGVCAIDCAGVTCGGHGTCTTTTGLALCTCDATYGGDDCTACASGYQDEDADGVCSPACSASQCGAHGVCSHADGSADCTCDAGYAGAACATCASGYQDADGDDTCEPTCETSGLGTCSDHGTCSESTGTATCGCDAGYAGTTCDECASGYQDEDENGTCEPDCALAALACGDHGVCSVASGTAVCDCEHHFQGAACDTCPAGFGGAHCDYRIVYHLEIPQQANWDALASVPYAIDTTASTVAFDRIAYELTLDTSTVWAEMDAFTDVATKIGVPADEYFEQSVTNLTVASNKAGVTNVTNGANGRIEFWSHQYGVEPGDFGVDDYIYQDAPDAYGSMQVHDGTATVLAFNRWSGSGNVELGIGTHTVAAQADYTNTQNGSSYTTRQLTIWTRDLETCGNDACSGHGTCDDASGAAVCACAEGYAGLRCAGCATGFNDEDHDGVCVADCGGGSCDGLGAAIGLPTGLHTLRLLSGDTQVYVDGSTDGGGFVLIGRGREGWDWNELGRGTAEDVVAGLGTSDAFAPAYLSTAIVQRLIDETPGVDLRDVEVRIRRAENVAGTSYQDVRWTFLDQPTWHWQLDRLSSTTTTRIEQTIGVSLLGFGGTWTTMPRDTNGATGNNANRIFTFAYIDHGWKAGFSYGTTVGTGTNNATSFLWENGAEDRNLPYTEVYLRMPSCATWAAGSCGTGTCDDSSGVPVCLCAAPASDAICTPTCLEEQTQTGCTDAADLSCSLVNDGIHATADSTYCNPGSTQPYCTFTGSNSQGASCTTTGCIDDLVLTYDFGATRSFNRLRFLSDWWAKKPYYYEVYVSDDPMVTPSNGATRVAGAFGQWVNGVGWKCTTGDACDELTPAECCPNGVTQDTTAVGTLYPRYDLVTFAPRSGRYWYFVVRETRDQQSLILREVDFLGDYCL